MVTKIIGGKIIAPDSVLEGYSLYFEGGSILAITKDDLPFDDLIDAGGKYVSPGFIDIHTHGGGGFDFMHGTLKSLLQHHSSNASILWHSAFFIGHSDSFRQVGASHVGFSSFV